jgi:hypothetical protein
MTKQLWLLSLVIPAQLVQPAEAQLLKKIKDKAGQVTNKVLDKKVDDATGTGGNTQGANGPDGPGTPGGKGRSGNTTGGGLVSTPPDVTASLTDAETAFKKNQYGDARFSVQQAMLGVEMMIGKEILKGLPDSIGAIKKDTTSDKVTSTSWGWVGLTMQRDYFEGGKQNMKDNRKEIGFMLSNNSAWMQAINLYFSGGYAQTSGSGDTQNWKQTRLKGYKAVIEFEQSSGYKISVPIGQTSLLILQGVNFATEQDFMNACNAFDIDKIKTQLGEK